MTPAAPTAPLGSTRSSRLFKAALFSLPLMANGGVMILSDQATRLLVGARLSVADLAGGDLSVAEPDSG